MSLPVVVSLPLCFLHVFVGIVRTRVKQRWWKLEESKQETSLFPQHRQLCYATLVNNKANKGS